MKKYLIILLIVLSSCSDSLFNSGDIITQEIEIMDFNKIYIDHIFDIFLLQDSVCKISVTAGENLIPNLEFIVDQDKSLHIKNLNTANWSRKYEKIKLYISVDTLSFLQLNSPSNVTCIDTLKTPGIEILSLSEYSDIEIKLKCDHCYIVNSGTSGGQIKISGETNTFGFRARASFKLNSRQFKANYVDLISESIGDCFVFANKELNVEILNSGLVYYSGKPDTIIYVNEKAKEQLIKLN